MRSKKIVTVLFAILVLWMTMAAGKCGGGGDGTPVQYVDVKVCKQSRQIFREELCPEGEVVKFKKGEEPTVVCEIHKPTVSVNVCLDSSRISTKWCLHAADKLFEVGQEPKEACDIHQKILLKKQLWIAAYDVMTANGDLPSFVRTTAIEGSTGYRIMYQYAWGENILSPYPQVGFWRAGYADAPDLPFYDQGTEEVPAWNEAYWKKVDELNSIIAYYEQRIYADVHDGCSFRMGGWQKYRYPFLSSSPDRSKDDPEVNVYPGGFWGMQESSGGRKTAQFLHERFIRKLVEGWRAKGIAFKIEFVNEDPMTDWDADYVKTYYKYMGNFLESLGIPKSDIIGSGRREGFEYLGLYSIHGVVRPDRMPETSWPHERIIISGDGGFDGQGLADAKGRKGVSADDAALIAAKILEGGFAGAEYLCRNLYNKDNDKATLRDYDAEPQRRFVAVWKK